MSRNDIKIALEGFEIKVKNYPKKPKVLIVELTSDCNMKCRYCYRNTWSEEIGYMSEEMFDIVLKNAVDAGVELINFAGFGEPTIHPRFCEWVRRCKELGFEVSVNTNGTMLLKYMDTFMKYVDYIVVSLHEPLNDLTLNGLKELSKRKFAARSVKPYVIGVIVLHKDNIGIVKKIPELQADLELFKVVVSNVIPTSPEFSDKVVALDPKLSDAARDALALSTPGTMTITCDMKPQFPRACEFVRYSAVVVLWNGKVAPCYYLAKKFRVYYFGVEKVIEPFIVGDLSKERLIDIWNKPEYVMFRLKNAISAFPTCLTCSFVEFCTFYSEASCDCWGNDPTCAPCPFRLNLTSCITDPREYIKMAIGC